MARLPQVRNISKATLGELASPLERFLREINQFVGDVVEALSSNLTVTENLAQCWVDLTIVYGRPIPVLALPALKGRLPYGVSVEGAVVTEGSLFGAPGLEWEAATLNGAPALRVVQAHGLNVGTTVRFRLLVKAQ